MIKSLVVVACAAFVMGCSMTAPQYTPSVANIGQLKTAKLKPLAVEKVAPDPALKSNESIGLRGSSMSSPTGSYSSYIEEALKSEFQLAGLLDPLSSTKLSGVVVKNDVNVGGFSTGDSIIEARVKITKDGTVAYDKLKTATLQFESSFAGAVAIPKGRDMYPMTVQKFIEILISDSDFVSALK
jgi:hypothetical protein